MQRAAASASLRDGAAGSPVQASSPQHTNGHPLMRQKFSSSVPQSPAPNASTPRSTYQSSEPGTPLPQDALKSSTQESYGSNEAETPWVLNVPGSTATQRSPSSSPEEETSPPIIGRRTFGDFKKTAPGTATPKTKREEDDSLSSLGSDDDYEDHGERVVERTSRKIQKEQARKRKEWDDEVMDKVNLKKMKNGISAASGLRQPPFDGRKQKKE
jgi:hypothetical protein